MSSIFPKFIPDPGHKRQKEVLIKSGFQDWSAVLDMLQAAETEDEERAIFRKIPLTPLSAWCLKKQMGKEAFLAEGYNLDYANESFGGPDWVDRL